MKILIDTNRYSDFARNVTDVVELFAHAETIFVPFAVVAELRAGFRSGTLSRRNEVTLVKFLNNDRVSVLYPDDGTSRTYAELYAELRANGTTRSDERPLDCRARGSVQPAARHARRAFRIDTADRQNLKRHWFYRSKGETTMKNIIKNYSINRFVDCSIVKRALAVAGMTMGLA